MAPRYRVTLTKVKMYTEYVESKNENETPRSKLRGIKTFCLVLLLAASRG